jgi:hypothetical protein
MAAEDGAHDETRDGAGTDDEVKDGAEDEHEPAEAAAEPGLYRLKDVLEAVAQGLPIAVVKEKAEADALWEIGVPATTSDTVGATNGTNTALHEHLHGADIILVPNNDDAGYGLINEVGAVLINIVKRIRVLRLAPIYGVSAWLESGGTFEQWRMLIEIAPDWVPIPSSPIDPEAKRMAEAEEKELLENLAMMNELDYDRQRKAAARRLGIREAVGDGQR